jgi:hypothetical protein
MKKQFNKYFTKVKPIAFLILTFVAANFSALKRTSVNIIE